MNFSKMLICYVLEAYPNEYLVDYYCNTNWCDATKSLKLVENVWIDRRHPLNLRLVENVRIDRHHPLNLSRHPCYCTSIHVNYWAHNSTVIITRNDPDFYGIWELASPRWIECLDKLL